MLFLSLFITDTTFDLMAFNRVESDRIQEEEMFKISLGSSNFHVVSFSRKQKSKKTDHTAV